MSAGSNDGSISPETIELLGAVRKGKTCAYVLGYKPTKVGSLLIRKKMPQQTDIAAARRGGNSVAWGVVKAQAANVTFYLARADGFQELPFDGKIDKLRQFLNEATAANNQKWTPTLMLVDENPPLDLDDSLVNHPLVRRFNGLQPAVVALLDVRPQLASEFEERAKAIRRLLPDAATIDSAAPLIDEYEAQLRRLSTEQPATVADAGAATNVQPRSDAERAAFLAEKLKQLRPQIDKALEGNPQWKPELFGAVANCAGRIKNKEFDAAESEIAELATRLSSLLGSRSGSSNPTSGSDSDARQKWESRRSALEPDLLAAQRAAPDRAAKLGAVWDYANSQAAAGNFTNANTALDRLQTAVGDILAAAPRTGAETHGIEPGIIARRVRELEPLIRQRIAEIASATLVDVSELGTAIENKMAVVMEEVLDEDMEDEIEDDASDIERGVQWYLQDLLEEVEENLLASLKAGDTNAVEAAIQSCQQRVADDPLMQRLADAPQIFQAEVRVDKQLSRLFQDARDAMSPWTSGA